MAQTVNVKNIGLRGVTVADTKISFIDGDNGILIYRGYRIEELAEKATFMEVAFLILYGYLPNRGELKDASPCALCQTISPLFLSKPIKALSSTPPTSMITKSPTSKGEDENPQRGSVL